MSALPDFDPLRVPLDGLHLVEASAGTGKTWSITSLLLRAIALEGRAIDAMVVVTFTEAATRELRDRLRRRLEEAVLQLDGLASTPDRFVTALQAESAAAGIDTAVLRQRLADARIRCDEAWVHTIHALCARWMAEFAFEQGLGLAPWPVEEGSTLRREAVLDVWRRRLTGGGDEGARLVATFGTPEKLMERLLPLFGLPPGQIDGADASSALDALRSERAALVAELASLIDAGACAALAAAFATPKRYHGSKLGPKQQRGAFDALHSVAAGGAFDAKALERLQPQRLREALNKGHEDGGVSEGPLPRWVERWLPLHARIGALEPLAWLHRLLAEARAREAELRMRHRRLGFDDLVMRMRSRVEADPRLAQRLAARFPLAVVDEFQDTDEAQYAIFRAIYRGRVDAALFLVGDPKQAIYRFRGGDIFAYRRAMLDAGQHHGLRHNWRSRQRLVDAVNALFGGRGDAFLFDFIGFTPVALPDDLSRDDPSAGLVVWQLPADAQPLEQEAAERAVVDAVAAEIARLIEAGGVEAAAEPPIAVLVGRHAEAQQVRAALARWGVPCAYAGEDSVWSSDAAGAVFEALDALAHPRDIGRQRRVLAGPLFDVDAAALAAEHGHAEVDAGLEALSDARRRGGRSGPAAALLPLIAAVAPTRLGLSDGRRWLADALHLLDLLGELWPEVEDFAGLADRMGQQIADARERGSKPAEAARLRPESDRALVRLMTVHGSKGLEFDIVFVPFLWRDARRKAKRDSAVHWHDEAGLLRCDPGTERWDLRAEEAAREQFAESLRLAYVALTRARRRCYLAFGPTLRGRPASTDALPPLGWLLDGSATFESDSIDWARAAAGLEGWAQACAGVEIAPLPTGVQPRRIALPATPEPPPPRQLGRRIGSGRRIVSYSSLFADAHDAERPDHDRGVDQALPDADGNASLAPAVASAGGVRFGECVHWALERVDFASWPHEAGERIARAACDRYGYGEDVARYLAERIGVIARAPLVDGMRLAALEAADRIAELEFCFPLREASFDGFFDALAAEPRYRRAPAARTEHFDGFLRGFIDLVARWQGRWYVIDYKSNRLGDLVADYRPAALASAIRESNYDLQYLIYLLALHRLLRARLGASYDYERDVGGACYVYLRGLDAAGECGVHVDRPPRAVIEALDAWAAGQGR